MSIANLSAFARNVKVLPAVVPTLINNAKSGMITQNKWAMRAEKHAPEDYNMQFERITPTNYQRSTCETKNLWIDTKWGDDGNSREELAKRWYFITDRWLAFHTQLLPACFGGWAFIAAQAYCLANDSWLCSAFTQVSAENKKAYFEGKDNLRYKYTPAWLNQNKFLLEASFPVPSEKWNDVHEKNDVRRNPNHARDVAKFYSKYYPLHIQKRTVTKGIMRSMGMCPSFPLFKRVGATTRMRDIFECIFTEDVMVIKQKLVEKMSDEELFCYAWRRWMAPADKNLSRAELIQRVEDYHEFLGPEILDGKHPGIVGTYMYLLGYYNDPAFLDQDFSELEKNDFENLGNWSRDHFMKRMEFENGPLRDQIEAHVAAKKAEREAKLAEVAKKQELEA